MKKLLIFAFSFLMFSTVKAQDPDSTEVLSDEAMTALYQAWADSVTATFIYDTGMVTLKDDLAKLVVPEGFKYLNPEGAEIVLTNLWGNPPSQPGYGSLGMLFPKDISPMDDNTYAIDITWSEEGYIDDADAKDIDYDELLETIQEDARLASEQRVEMGYQPVEIVGWASEPFYDVENKKLHWAQEIKFGDDPDHTLNYNIRILGRRGYLNMNVIGGMAVLPDVKANINTILPSVEFNDGHRYVDFDASIDEVAAVGIGGLIAGKVLAKAGILAKVGILLAKFWKFIAIGAVALFAGLRKFLRGGKEETPA